MLFGNQNLNVKFQRFTLQEYTDAGCFQMEIPDLGRALWVATRGMMCDGCPVYNGGSCASLKKMTKPAPVSVHTAPGETVKQEALRRGVTIAQVRRERNPSS